MASAFGVRGFTRRRLLIVALALGAMIPIAIPGFANLPGSPFDAGDGNLALNDEAQDWANAPNLQSGLDVPSGKDDNSFGQGTSEDDAVPTVVTGSIPNQKSDLTRFYVANQTVGANSFLYMAWERVQEPNGTTNMDFEFNQSTSLSSNGVTPVRTAGDALIKFDLSSGGTNPSLGFHRWITSGTCEKSGKNPPCWGKGQALTGSAFEASINAGSVTDPIPPNAPRTLDPFTFGEAAVNLTTSGILPPGTCSGFGRAYLKSRSSDSFTAEIKDFIAPIPVNINNCGTVVINKTGVGGGPLAGATFSLKNDASPTGIGAVPPGAQAGPGGEDTSTGFSCTTNAQGTCSIALVPIGNYWLLETTTPPGYVTLAPVSFNISGGGQVVTFNLANQPAPGTINIHKQDDDSPANPLQGAVFQLFADNAPFGPANPGGGAQTSHGAEDTAVAGKTCTTNASGDCSISNVALGRYWVVETTTPSGYATAADQNVVVGLGSGPGQGQTINLTFTNPRLFKVIVIVCQKSNNQPYASKVAFDGGSLPNNPNSIGPGGGGAVTDAQLCALGGATHDNVPKGGHSASVDIPQ